MRKKILTALLTLSMIVSIIPSKVQADDYSSTVYKFVDEISDVDEFESWEDASVEFGYSLYNEDCTTVDYQLFYVLDTSNSEIGYLIYDLNADSVVEFSIGDSPYDLIDKNACLTYTYIYNNAWPECYVNEAYYSVNYDGSLEYLWSENAIMSYDPHLQNNDNCIVCAISNILWYHGQNGHPNLISGATFTQVKNRVKSIMNGLGGYTNNNIPGTINSYVNTYTSYSVSVYNHWSPTFSNVSSEVAARPCLLGFAAGSPYSATQGHMTVCVNAMTQMGHKLVGLMDGHHTYIVYKEWGSYNDFMSKVIF